MKIYSWGSNSHGQLGQGTEAEQILLPAPINITVEPKFITGGGKHTILLTTKGEILACGDNDKGQLGKKPTVKPINTFQYLSFPFKISKVSCGWDFNLILTEDNEVFGLGSNSFGQLGLDVKKTKYLCKPFKIFQRKVLDVAAGLRHSAVVTLDGLVFTCGYGRKGQLGVLLSDGAVPTEISEFTLVKNIDNCEEISCGECHCIAKTTDGKLYSWGNNKHGQLGLNPEINPISATPVQITANIKGNYHIFSGWAHNLILTENGQLISWGRNYFGQLGEQRQHTWKPELIKNLERVKQVSLGSHHSVVLTEDGVVLTWGWNEHGNCGNGFCENVLQPNKLPHVAKLIGSGAAHCFLWS